MSRLNSTQLGRLAYMRWRAEMDRQGIRHFREPGGGLLEMLSSSWSGGTGMVYLNYVLDARERHHHTLLKLESPSLQGGEEELEKSVDAPRVVDYCPCM